MVSFHQGVLKVLLYLQAQNEPLLHCSCCIEGTVNTVCSKSRAERAYHVANNKGPSTSKHQLVLRGQSLPCLAQVEPLRYIETKACCALRKDCIVWLPFLLALVRMGCFVYSVVGSGIDRPRTPMPQYLGSASATKSACKLLKMSFTLPFLRLHRWHDFQMLSLPSGFVANTSVAGLLRSVPYGFLVSVGPRRSTSIDAACSASTSSCAYLPGVNL